MSLSLLSEFLGRACDRELGNWEPPAQRFFSGTAAYRKTLGCGRGGGWDGSPGSVQLAHLMNGKRSNTAPDIAKRSIKWLNRGDAEIVTGSWSSETAKEVNRAQWEPTLCVYACGYYHSMVIKSLMNSILVHICVLAFSQTSYQSSMLGNVRIWGRRHILSVASSDRGAAATPPWPWGSCRAPDPGFEL